MVTTFPVAKNPLTALQEFVMQSFNFSQVLDHARYIIRVDPKQKVGYFESSIKTGYFAGKLLLTPSKHGQHYALSTNAAELPTQVQIALERAGYAINTVQCGA